MAEKMQIIIDVESGNATTTLKKIDKGVDEVGKSAKAAQKPVAGLTKLVGGLAIGATALAASTKLIGVARNFDIINSSLITVTGSAKNADAAFANIEEFAARTPFDLEQVANAFVKMKALGLDPSNEALTSYGNTASAMGKDLNQMIEAIADAATGEFERLKEFGIKSKSEGDNVSFTFRGITTTVGKNSEEIQGYLKEIGDVDFAGAMDRRAATLDGALSNLGDSWDGLFRTIANAGVGSLVADTARQFSEAIDDIGFFIDFMSGKEENLQLAGEINDTTEALEKLKAETKAAKEEGTSFFAAFFSGEKLEVAGDAQIAAMEAKLQALIEKRNKLTEEASKGADDPASGGNARADKAASIQLAKEAKKLADESEQRALLIGQRQANEIQAAQDYFDRVEEVNATNDMTEREREEAKFLAFQEQIARREQSLVDAGLTREEAEAESLDAIAALRENHDKSMRDLDAAAADAKLSQASQTFGMLANLMNNGNNELFEIGRLAAAAQTIVDTYAGATKALAQGGVFGFIGAAAIIATGVANLQKINSTKIGGGSTISNSGSANSSPDMSGGVTNQVPTIEPIDSAQPVTGTTVNVTVTAIDPASVSASDLERIGEVLAPSITNAINNGLDQTVGA